MPTTPNNRDSRQADIDALALPISNDEAAAERPSRLRISVMIALALLLLCLTFYGGLFFGRSDNSVPKTPTAPVEVPAAQPEETAASFNVPARIFARRRTTVSSTYTALLKRVLVREGDRVEAGQPLAELDIAESRASRDAAAGRLSQSLAAITSARVALKRAETQLARSQALSTRGFISKSDLDERLFAVDDAAARVRQAQGARESSLAELRNAEAIVGRAIIRAPFSGIVSQVSAQPGEVVSPISAGGGFVRTGICTLIDLNSRQIEAYVPERYLDRISIGQRAEFTSGAIKGLRVSARVSAIGSELDAQRGAILVTLDLLDPAPQLLPNMNGTARLTKGSR